MCLPVDWSVWILTLGIGHQPQTARFRDVTLALLLKGNMYPNEPVGSYPWWEWAAVGAFLLFCVLVTLVRRRR